MVNDRKALLVRITGRVQGVNYRAWARIEAEKLGLDGWVRNEDDGSVSALIAGPPRAVDAMVERFWAGPPAARVTQVIGEGTDPARAEAGFRISR